jgi:urease accessory protein
MVSAAVRLNIFGPYAGQTCLMQLQPSMQDILQRCQNTALDEAGMTSPLFDVIQGLHDNLYSRIFNS